MCIGYIGLVTTPRERARAQTFEDITRIGRSHLATDGAASLSLRAVARDLGVVSSAVYRYVKSRDELLTLLVVDAYTELGDAVDAAVNEVPADNFPEQFKAVGRTVRTWGLAESSRYALLFGSPVPGYHAPADRTTGPGTRVIMALVSIFAAASAAGAVTARVDFPVPASLRRDFEVIRTETGTQIPDAVLGRGLATWASLFGVVSFDVFDQYGSDTFTDRDEVFEYQLGLLAEMAGLDSI